MSFSFAIRHSPFAIHSSPRSILVVLPTWVGDFVMATPLLGAIRRRYDRARITFLAEPNLRDLIAGGRWMDECLEWPVGKSRNVFSRDYRGLVRKIRAERYDWAVLLPNSFRAALVAFLGRAKRRIGYNRDGRGLLLTDRLAVKNRHKGQFVPVPLVEYLADLGEAIGCDRPSDELELFTTPNCDQAVEARLTAVDGADRHPLVVISPGAKYGAAKCWQPQRFAETADRMIRRWGATVIVTCGPGEESIARQIGSAMTENGLVFDNPILTLGQLKSLIARADLLLCNDAGPRHFAKAFDVPVVTIFGPTHPRWTDTSYQAERIVRIDVDCGPCQQRICPLGHLKCMTGVTVDAVFNAATELVRELVARSGTPGRGDLGLIADS